MLLEIATTTGLTLAAIVRNDTAEVYNGSSFETYDVGNRASYLIALTEQGTSGYYTADFPTVTDGVYGVVVYKQAGGSPAETDPIEGEGTIDTLGSSGLSTAEHNQLMGLPAATDIRAEIDSNSTKLAEIDSIVVSNLDAKVSELVDGGGGSDVWDEPVSAHDIPDTFGKYLKKLMSKK